MLLLRAPIERVISSRDGSNRINVPIPPEHWMLICSATYEKHPRRKCDWGVIVPAASFPLPRAAGSGWSKTRGAVPAAFQPMYDAHEHKTGQFMNGIVSPPGPAL